MNKFSYRYLFLHIGGSISEPQTYSVEIGKKFESYEKIYCSVSVCFHRIA